MKLKFLKKLKVLLAMKSLIHLPLFYAKKLMKNNVLRYILIFFKLTLNHKALPPEK